MSGPAGSASDDPNRRDGRLGTGDGDSRALDGPNPSVATGAVAGVLGTAAIDVGARLLAPTLGAQPLHPALLGRWSAHLLNGRVRHYDITTATAVPGEAVVGAITHYAIGVALGSGYVLTLRLRRTGLVSLPSAIGYGTATTAFAWFALFPSMGFGVIACHARQRKLLQLSLLNHAIFGLGLGMSIRRLTNQT